MRQQINLHHAFVTPPIRLPAKQIAMIVGGLLLVLLAYGSYLHWQAGQVEQHLESEEQALEQLNTSIRELDTALTQRQPSAALQQRLEQRQAALQYRRRQSQALTGGLSGQRQGYSEFLSALARQHQDGLWLTGLSLRYGQREVVIQGRSLSPALVPQWLQGFTQEPALADQQFAQFSIGSEEPDDEADTAGLAFQVQSQCNACREEEAQ